MLRILLFSMLVMSAILSAEDDDEKAIKNVTTEFTKAWNDHDYKAIANFWTEDGEVLSPWKNKVIKGRQELENYFLAEHKDEMKNSSMQLTIDGIRFINQDVAFVDANMTLLGMTVAGEQAAPFRDHTIFVLVKKESQWKILIARPY